MLAMWLPLLGLAVVGTARSRRRKYLVIGALLALTLLQFGCGAAVNNLVQPPPAPTVTGTPAGTYTITVSAGSGLLTHTVTATVTVQ